MGVFISYSHQDQAWLEKLRTMLAPLERKGAVNVWADTDIRAGQEWQQEIQTALAQARVAVLLVSPDFLKSDFIARHELPPLLNAARQRGLRIVWVPVRPSLCHKTEIGQYQAAHDPAKSLSTLKESEQETALVKIAEVIEAAFSDSPSPIPPPQTVQVSPSRLPITGEYLIGRETELQRLDAAWNDPKIHILSIIAWGGVGKTALINTWLGQMAGDNYRGAERVFDWTFYSQGTSDERVASADAFIDAALRWFGDPDSSAGSPWERGERLAGYVRQQRMLLILDGLEPLQYPPGQPQERRLKDPALQALVRGLTAVNPGLCVITSREVVEDLASRNESTAPVMRLEHLSAVAGAILLRKLGVQSTAEELQKAAQEVQGHALALMLLGKYLHRVWSGDVWRRDQVRLWEADERQGGQARRVMEAYERWFGQGPEVAILRLVGLFDRAADGAALSALRAEPVIVGLTDALHGKSEADWRYAVGNLREAGLLAVADPHALDTLDAHPLVREHFGEQLRAQHPEAWRAGHERLYEYLKAAAPELPETLEAMLPLYAAVGHGCRAGRRQEALDEVYWRRILRGDMHFSWRKLGAFGAEVAALSGFFDPP